MVHINIKKGLDIPIKGTPKGELHPIDANGHLVFPAQIALNLAPFEETKFHLLCKPGDIVKVGQPLAEDQTSPGKMFVAPAAGIVKEVRRGLKRRLMDIIIDTNKREEFITHPPLEVEKASLEEILTRLKEGGIFPHIRQRPFDLPANPNKTPRCIFVKAIESAPFAPSAEMQVTGYEKEFQVGLNALAKLTSGSVHLVYRKDSRCDAFISAKKVQKHTAEGPHPIGTHSVHIHLVDPVKGVEDTIWTLNVHTVISIGYLLTKGRYFTERIISIAGPSILPERTGFFRAREGYPIGGLIAGRIEKGEQRLISGDALTGDKVDVSDFLGFYHFGFCVFPENVDREFLHFFRLGVNKFSASRAYLSGHLKHSEREYSFTTSQHGEKRAFVISSPYDEVMPMRIPTMQLVKAVMAEDFDLAEALGLLEVIPEDFALATFVCPSKIEMVEIIKEGLKNYSKEVLV